MNRECISYETACERFDTLLDDYGSGPVVIAGITFDRSRILRELDPTGYREGVLKYAEATGYDIMEYEV